VQGGSCERRTAHAWLGEAGRSSEDPNHTRIRRQAEARGASHGNTRAAAAPSAPAASLREGIVEPVQEACRAVAARNIGSVRAARPSAAPAPAALARRLAPLLVAALPEPERAHRGAAQVRHPVDHGARRAAPGGGVRARHEREVDARDGQQPRARLYRQHEHDQQPSIRVHQAEVGEDRKDGAARAQGGDVVADAAEEEARGERAGHARGGVEREELPGRQARRALVAAPLQQVRREGVEGHHVEGQVQQAGVRVAAGAGCR